ncbi:hypothetical protein [Christiangramia sp. SM2212]|uniref:NERD domain-containing protein n=1 Tax=Christiangramia sediminicola TaxID=3073267 RepID=A0ABU1EUE9_9FLAO|nr:hypothetical protein [Christiangramia sp. SM2212]MDR5591647.1 hypothetical protein [Christiangramia sp. SM2212]
MTPSERYVASLCQKSFLPFWSFPNPIGKKNKELCDVLVVCGNYVLIISVKDIRMSNHSDENVRYERWIKKAIEDSAKQIYGAERYLKTVNEVYAKNRTNKISLPPKNERIIFRIAIAFGSDNTIPLPYGDFSQGYVHVFDEESTSILLSELDTITDFTKYLSEKVQFLKEKYFSMPKESDFLAFYIQTGLDIDEKVDSIVSEGGLWDSYIESDEYAEWQELLPQSNIWDYMITQLHHYHISEETTDERRNDFEDAVREINQESRINRIELGGILDNAIQRKLSARMLRPLKDAKHCYTFMPLTSKNWEGKEKELELRCIVARMENPNVERVIGIAFGNNGDGQDVYDICAHYIPEISEEFIALAKEVRDELGHFKKPTISNSKEYRKEDFKGFGL